MNVHIYIFYPGKFHRVGHPREKIDPRVDIPPKTTVFVNISVQQLVNYLTCKNRETCLNRVEDCSLEQRAM